MAGIFQCARGPTPRAFVFAARLARGWLVATTCPAGGPDGKCRSPIAIAPAILRHAPIRLSATALVLTIVATFTVPAQEAGGAGSSLFSEMQWRSIGPSRASRTRGGRRAPQPAVHVLHWRGQRRRVEDDRLRDARGRRSSTTSRPDRSARSRSRRRIRTSSTSAAGKGCSGPICPSATASTNRPTPGKTWTHLGLRDAQQIPRDRGRPAQRESALRRGARPSVRPERRARHLPLDRRRRRRSRRSCSRTRTPAATTSTSIPPNPDIVYATLWEERQGPWENAVWAGTDGGIFKSTDGGTTWNQLTKGLPEVVQANVAISPANPKRALRDRRRVRCAAARARTAAPAASTDQRRRAARTGRRSRPTTAPAEPHRRRRSSGADPHPKDPDSVIIASTVSWKSTDGGKTWAPFKGAPGGDDYQNGWINPDNPDIIMLAADQGAVDLAERRRDVEQLVQPADRGALSRGRRQRVSVSRVQRPAGERVGLRRQPRQLTARSPIATGCPVGVDEYGYVAPDPLDPDIVYGGRTVTRFDRRTGQTSGVGPVGGAAPSAARRELPSGADDAGRVFGGRSARRCSSPTMCSGRRSTAGRTGGRSART